jgi:hypothetical protein
LGVPCTLFPDKTCLLCTGIRQHASVGITTALSRLMWVNRKRNSSGLHGQTGHPYRFRYLLDESRWENDWKADRYEPNPFGSDDSIVDLVAASVL